jgi:hypothetical protein
MAAIDNECDYTLEQMLEIMKKYADRDPAEPLKYSKADLVMLITINIRTRTPWKQLDPKFHGPIEITEVISKPAVHLNLAVKWTLYNGCHDALLEPFIQGNLEVNLDKVLDAADSIEADDKYHVEEVMGTFEKKGKVSYPVKWRGFLAKNE